MMRRILTLVVAAALAAGAAGCAVLPGSGNDTAQAASLLQKASSAMQHLKTVAFTLSMTGSGAGQTFSFTMNGKGKLKGEGEGEGDFELHGAMDIPSLSSTTFDLVSTGGTVWIRMPGQGWQQTSASALGSAAVGQQQQTELQNKIQQQLSNLDLTKYVKDVTVDKDTVFLGEPVTKISGTLDTAGLLKGVFDQLGSSAGSIGAPLPTSQVLDALGDTRVVLYVSDTLHYLRAAHASLTISAQGQKMTMDVDFSIHDVNGPVEIKAPA